MAHKENGPAGGAGKVRRGFSRWHRNSPPSQVATPRQEPINVELSGSDHCAALGITVQSTTPVLQLCWKLIEAGYDPNTALHAYRGNVLALRVRSIGIGARLRIGSHGVGFEAVPACGAGPPVRFDGPVDGRIGSSLGGAAP
jgi:hypothetical protein